MQVFDEDKPEDELTCGWRSFKPRVLQKLNTPKWFLVFLTIYSFMQGEDCPDQFDKNSLYWGFFMQI